ncbi:uncharacterized protein PHALS_13842 [Plasmopara halstedii]|uniref:Uncharacterized protein n=1 Tax=Plasmopara halstedii TaxID=4781 RepID=A0A0P1A4J7_PLAHL|nr:uncharacterized protein PHALS_13842 [Plasmopara halstedii]CEG35073.1 hypothetical protein PHALS_13842 [Plasmopara halstedii]|eukprot:XP_024571442.1 hypothetical protein PHALS_13842 [Plasmopara halstedii]
MKPDNFKRGLSLEANRQRGHSIHFHHGLRSGAVWVERTLRAHQELTHEYALNFEHSKLRPFAKQIVEWFIRVGNSGPMLQTRFHLATQNKSHRNSRTKLIGMAS